MRHGVWQVEEEWLVAIALDEVNSSESIVPVQLGLQYRILHNFLVLHELNWMHIG